MDTKILQEIGLTDGEIRVYLALIKLGSSTSGPIVDESKVSSSKIYNILERLIQKGFISFIIKDKTRHYQAEDPEKIKDYLNRREHEFIEQKKEIDKIIPQLQIQKELGKNKSEAQIFKGFKGVQAVHEHVYSKLKKGEDFFYFGGQTFQEEKYHLYWQKDHLRREKTGIICRMLFNQGTPRGVLKNRNSYKNSFSRYMPFPLDSPAWIFGYKDVTAIGLQEENLVIEIVNEKIAKSFRSYFEAMWKLSKPFK